MDILAYKLKENIMKYTENTLQSDDLTMLAFRYNGCDSNTKVFKTGAVKDNYKQFYNWLHAVCNEWKLSDELVNKIDMCAEEIFANVTFYAYSEGKGTITLSASNANNEITMKFIDEGVPYNPLEKPDPDITLPPEERQLGGLGIFMVKNMVDDIYYEYINNKNILTLKFQK